MQIVVICEKYSWTYKQFLQQPLWFIDLIREKMKIDSQKERHELDKIK